MTEQIIDAAVEDELSRSYMEYGMSVIISRALPDVRDGLKPVHRRILYSMYDLGVRPDRAHVKCAKVVGDTMGRFHPHGDLAIYESLVRLAQFWSMRVPLIDPHGNFGSLDDGPAASRYCVVGDTRVRLADGTSPSIADLVNLAANTEADVSFDVINRDGKPVHVSKAFNSGVWPTKRLRTSAGNSIRGSHNHLILCLGADQLTGEPTLIWRQLDEITPGTIVCLARNAPHRPGMGMARDNLLGLLLGAWVSEGWASSERAGFNNTDEAYFQNVVTAYDVLVGGPRYTSSRELPSGRPIYELDVHKMDSIGDSPLASLIGQRAADKRIPKIIWTASPAAKRAFLGSLFEGDGSVGAGPTAMAMRSFTVQYSTYSPLLAAEVQELLLEFGVHSTFNAYKKNSKIEYRLVISGQANIAAFADRVGFASIKQQRLITVIETLPKTPHRLSGDHAPYVASYVRRVAPRGGRNWLTQHNFDRMDRWEAHRMMIQTKLRDPDLVKSVSRVMDSRYRFVEVIEVQDDEPTEVYSLRVDTDDHSFLAGGFVNHNTECRLTPAGMALLDDIREATVDFVPSYDNSDTEPTVLPSAFPNLLVNGSQGIAVGMATNIAPHNLREVTSALQAMLERPEITLDEIMVHIPGPDFPTGAMLYQLGGVRDAYATGKGAFRLRARSRIVEVSSRKRGIEFTEMPYQVSPEKVIKRIKSLLNQKQLQGVADAKDLTDRKYGIRLLVECKTGFSPETVLANLYRLTDLDVSFSINTVCLVDGNPQTLGLLDLCKYFLEHRQDVVTRRTKFRLEKAEARCHIIEGILIALAAIEEVVAILKSSKDTDIARKKLMSTYKLSEIQVQHIIEMPLRRLVGLEITKLKAELKDLKAEIAALNKILKEPKEMRRVISEELGATAQLYGVDRASELVADLAAPEEVAEELEPDEPCVIALGLAGTIARFPLNAKKGSLDPQKAILTTSVRAKVAAITSLGRAHSVDVAELALLTKRGRGNPATEYVELSTGEEVIALVPMGSSIALATRSGVIKRLDPGQFPTRLPAPIIKLNEGDVVIGAGVATEQSDLIMVSDDAQLLRTPASKIRPQGRSAGGVQGMKLGDGAGVIAFSAAVVTDQVLVTMSDQGTLKSTPLAEYPAKGRGGIGVRCQRLLSGESRLGDVLVASPQEALAVDAKGQAITGELPKGRRDGSGVRLSVKPAGLARQLLAAN